MEYEWVPVPERYGFLTVHNNQKRAVQLSLVYSTVKFGAALSGIMSGLKNNEHYYWTARLLATDMAPYGKEG